MLWELTKEKNANGCCWLGLMLRGAGTRGQYQMRSSGYVMPPPVPPFFKLLVLFQLRSCRLLDCPCLRRPIQKGQRRGSCGQRRKVCRAVDVCHIDGEQMGGQGLRVSTPPEAFRYGHCHLN